MYIFVRWSCSALRRFSAHIVNQSVGRHFRSDEENGTCEDFSTHHITWPLLRQSGAVHSSFVAGMLRAFVSHVMLVFHETFRHCLRTTAMSTGLAVDSFFSSLVGKVLRAVGGGCFFSRIPGRKRVVVPRRQNVGQPRMFKIRIEQVLRIQEGGVETWSQVYAELDRRPVLRRGKTQNR